MQHLNLPNLQFSGENLVAIPGFSDDTQVPKVIINFISMLPTSNRGCLP